MIAEDRIPPVKPDPTGRVVEATQNLRAAQAYASHYLAAQFDRVKLAVRNIIILSVVGILGLVAGVVIIAMTIVLLCNGIAGGFSRLYGGIPWLGDLTTAAFFLLLFAIGIKWGVGGVVKTSRRQLNEAYERRKSQQRAEFGADVHDRGQN